MGHQKTQPEPEQEDLVSLRDLLAQKDDQIAHLTHHLSAHTSHTSHLQHRLLTTLHTLDLLSFSHASQIAELEGEKKVLVEKGKRVADKLDRFVEWAGSVEADRDELREAVGMLIRKVELSNDDFSTWPYSNMHITKLLEPIVFDRHYSKTKHKHKARTKSNPTPHSYSRSRSPNDESFCTCPSPLPIQHTQSCDQRQYDQHHHITPRDRTDHPSNDQADLISYATSLIRTLTHERDSERKEHERTKREAGKRVRELEAVVGRLEGEVEALLCGVLGRGGATGNGGASEEVRGVREKERRKEERKKKRKSEENGGLPTQTQPSPRIPFESTPIQVGLMTQPNPISPTRLMTQEEAIAALEMAVVRNRGLEVEVKALGVRLERARAMKQLQEQGEEDERGGSSPEMGQESSRPNTPTLHNPLPQTKFEGYVNHSRKGSEDIVVPVTGGGDGPRPLERAFGPSPVPTQAHTSTSQVHTSTSQAHTSSTEAHTSASTQVHTSTSAQAHVSIPPPGHTPSSPLSRSPPPQRLSEDIVAGMEPPSPLPPELELTIHSLPSNDELSLQGGVEHEPRPLENPPRVSVHAEPEVQGESGVSVETLLPPLPHESQSRALQHLDEQIVLLREEVEKLKVERGLLAEMVGRAGLVRTSREWEAGQELSEEEFRGVLVLEEECIRYVSLLFPIYWLSFLTFAFGPIGCDMKSVVCRLSSRNLRKSMKRGRGRFWGRLRG
ncbi:hypothetical protein JAAARDRAFT_584715 [Jaapia argillacea MUCL 33604]|uniref:Uncharacterized protein n=1 Tax=Jaapia argillacea MUCL 33604 TaxID=933084 RepID=A0A067P6C9_9AGAM|nr:hypothetical protein JAAARDRAFT_584715 [Jaapia argillacea MUCL 33604]